ncbi:McrC family protein [Pontibacterium sp. N1Y112]|uniref:McrC family protein n=1 Tax=Pontibacterium sinense TaxID=2781979 RepID=A0A8J7FIN3_9GAMM|nr:McrC family protein [Pontibacterium sinense]MBE9396808.1 McrC family protein [Pontibacterium sinense]
MTGFVIREYGLLAREGLPSSISTDLNRQVIPASAWDWLLTEACGDGEHKQLVRPRKADGHLHLQVLNYVGSVTTPCGTHIEILPKHSEHSDEASLLCGRRLLIKMLNRVYGLNMREFERAHLQLFKQPLPEVLIGHFLLEVKQLVRRGIRADYRSQRDETTYLRGRLQIAAQLRQPPGRQHHFQVEYDDFLPDRPENRLLHSSLKQVLRWSQSLENQRLARELLFVFDDIPASSQYRNDFSRWQLDRNMQHYRACKPWCEFILNEQTPFTLAGAHFGQSFLFPMNDLFEKYVARVLERQLATGFQLREQAASRYLIDSHNDKSLFQLRPDLLIRTRAKPVAVLDCKWKLLDQNKNHVAGNDEKTYGLSQADIYQLYAYGQKYLGGTGCVYLVYPKHGRLSQPLPVFHYDKYLSLHVIPFCLDDDHFCLPSGDAPEWIFQDELS